MGGSAERLSGRQLSVAVTVAGLSPAAALAGQVDWLWLLVWCGVGVLLAWVVLRRVKGRPFFCGGFGTILYIMYMVWAAVLAGRTLGRAVGRLEMTSGGSSRFWLLLLLAVPLLCTSWGKPAPFFRMTEILWLVMALTVGVVLVFGVARGEWRYVSAGQDGWLGGLVAAAEILSPALFVLPYIYNVADRSSGRHLAWLSVLGGLAAALSLVTVGILGSAAERVPYGFYVAAGALGRSARCEGLLSVVWVLSDLTLAGLICRAWGGRKGPVLCALVSIILSISGIAERISGEICALGILILLLAILFLPRGKGKIVVDF